MHFLHHLKISLRLAIGFGIILCLLLLLGLVGHRGISEIWDRCETLYLHPYTVSNNVREIETHILAMHRSMKDVSISNSREELIVSVNLVEQNETEALEHFELIFERYLGDPQQIIQCRKLFIEWRIIRDEVIELTKSGKKMEAMAITKEKGADHVEVLLDQIQTLKAFADDMALSLRKEASDYMNMTLWLSILLLLVTFIAGTITAVLIIGSITAPIRMMVNHVNKMASGDLGSRMSRRGRDEIAILGSSLNQLQENLQKKLNVAQKVILGEYDVSISVQSEADELAIALNQMTVTLSDLNSSEKRDRWVRDGINNLNEILRGDKELISLCRETVSQISKYINAQVGVLYLRKADSDELHLVASHAFSMRKGLSDRFKLGEGIVGQAAFENTIISISDIPEDHIRVVSGLGDSIPRHLIAIPLSIDDRVVGVLEFASLHEFDNIALKFLQEAARSIAISVHSADSRNTVNRLLQETQQKSAELESQQEELRVTNEELQEHTKRLKDSEAQLQLQQQELAATNEELEEKNESLVTQKDEIDHKNRSLEQTRIELEEKAKQLEISSRYKSEFLANMSHELRTPLNSLLILSQDLMKNGEGNLSSDQIESASIINKGGNDLLQLINDILDLSKIEAGKLSMYVEPVNLDSCVDGLIKRFSPLAKDKTLRFSTEKSPELPTTIETDAQRFTQILTNLLSNAIKFTHEGQVELVLDTLNENAKSYLRILVKDTGIGIDGDKIHEIFEAFQQVDGSISRQYGGSGLGLSITRELCRMLGIRIQVSSELGVGSTFELIVPFQQVGEISEHYAASEPLPKAKSSAKKEAIESKLANAPTPIEDDRNGISDEDKVLLVIEDDCGFAGVLKKFSQKRGFKFLHTTTGEKGLEYAQEYRPCAIILDIYLPGIQGWEVLDRLKENENTRHIPVHMMSADSHPMEAMKKGAIGFVQKPVQADELADSFSKIESFLDKSIKELLIVEDDVTAQESLIKLIENEGISISLASDAEQAMALISERVFDCIILDIGLPDMSGIDLLRNLKNAEIESLPPVIIHTGQDISKEMEFELQNYSESIIIKGVRSSERLLDETALFLHQVIDELPADKRKIIMKLHDSDNMLHGKKVLLVDDDMRNVFALSKLFSDKGMEVLKAANGQKALDSLEEHPDVDIVLMDVMMPVMDGLEATRRIRKMTQFSGLPIVCVTAKAMKEDRQKCIEAGANDYVTKPVDIDRLFSVMRVWMYQ